MNCYFNDYPDKHWEVPAQAQTDNLHRLSDNEVMTDSVWTKSKDFLQKSRFQYSLVEKKR